MPCGQNIGGTFPAPSWRPRPRSARWSRRLLGTGLAILSTALSVSCTPSDESPRTPSTSSPKAEGPRDTPGGVDASTSPPPRPAVSISPERRREVEERLEEAEALRKAKKLDDVLGVLESLGPASDLPADLAATLLFYQGRTLFQKGMDAGEESGATDAAALFRAARTRLAEVARTYPKEADADSASYLLGSTYLMLDDLKEALKAYEETYDRYPQYENRSRALLRMGVCLAGLGQPARATETFRRLVADYPATDSDVTKAKKYLSEISIVGSAAPRVTADQWLLGLASGDALQVFRGEVIVLVFFATWCENCAAELPHLRRLIDRWTQQGAVFLGIANPDDPKNTSPVDVYVQKNQIPFHDVGLDRGGKSWRPYRVGSLPAAVVIDRQGRIAWRGHPSFFPTPLVERLLQGASR